MLNIDNKLFPYQSRISNYIIQSSIISLIILLFFAYNNNLIVFCQKSDSQFSGQDINIVSAGDFYCSINFNKKLIFSEHGTFLEMIFMFFFKYLIIFFSVVFLFYTVMVIY